MDYIVPFAALTEEDCAAVAERMLARFVERAEKAGIKLTVSEEVIKAAASDPECRQFGARPIRRFVEQTLENELIVKLASDMIRGETLLTMENGKVVYRSAYCAMTS